ncbi:ribonuclease P protein component [Mesomycoplasma neurolyticum]|uniref:Ribonuclease P protein component n=1 Tax=Mesomycoplasma neurolyticum TaxID=2120 RepID=A0A449A5Y0_9BACT|nr:ribonuclease P protein component [Mesomycoplasma neurolyticum]VEU59665.1 ribonuclease P protein component [Mesomycoplasma neurolyticum]
MKKQYILKKKWDFQKIINLKKQIITKNLILYFQKNDEFKLGISVPKKFSNAVKRNYYKRQVKAIMKSVDYENFNYHTILILRKDFLKLSFEKKKSEILKIYERLKNEKN